MLIEEKQKGLEAENARIEIAASRGELVIPDVCNERCSLLFS